MSYDERRKAVISYSVGIGKAEVVSSILTGSTISSPGGGGNISDEADGEG